MRESSKDRLEGKYHETKGKIKESAGRALNNPRVEIEGQDEKISGKVQERFGRAEKVVEKK